MRHFTVISALFALTAGSVLAADEVVPALIFGQNLEHTRSALEGGLSAQLVRNRKFAGKPSHMGVAAGWTGYGSRPVFDLLSRGFTRHAVATRMLRQNEISSQFISSLDGQGETGIRQDGLAVRGGVAHTFRAAVRTVNAEDVTFVVRIGDGADLSVAREFTVRSANETDWKRLSFSFTTDKDRTAALSIGVKGKTSAVVGAVSLMADDNFRGMRRDVIANLKDIGTTFVRWPGGNFAGEYRWRDGYIEDRDERAPIQSYTEIETQPYSLGYDQNDISCEDVVALCAELGAEPFFTINAVWDTPEESAEWVRLMKGRVKHWSLGNEMGYAHMEGPHGPEAYLALVKPHAEAMLKADPGIALTASGHFRSGDKTWIDGVAVPLRKVAPSVSYHHYPYVGLFDFTTPERTAASYLRHATSVDRFFDGLSRFRANLPEDVAISLDEWNVWYAWYRDDGIAEGLFAAKMIHRFLRDWKAFGFSYVCFFQPVNEGAIRVTPFASRLTSMGEAMRLMKGHVGGAAVRWRDRPDEVFATDHGDARYVTFYNFSTDAERSFEVPVREGSKIVSGETLVPDGLAPGNRFARKATVEAKLDGNVLRVTLRPAEIACVRLTAGSANLVLVGDSTLAPRTEAVRNGSWGDMLKPSLKDGNAIVNLAVGGRTVRTIRPYWEKGCGKIGKGDVVLFQFGINDANKKKFVDEAEFKKTLAEYADFCKVKGADVIFCSPLANGYSEKDVPYALKSSRRVYGDYAKALAAEKGVDFVDMTALTEADLKKAGRETALPYFLGDTERDGKKMFDSTHPTKAGAKRFAEIFLAEIRARKLKAAALFAD